MGYLIDGLFTWILLIGLVYNVFNLYILSILPKIDSLTFATLILAIATIALAWENHRLSKDSSKNIKISKDNLVEQHLLKEMEQLIKPLYENRKNFENLEFIHAYTKSDVVSFWKKRESDKYLATKDLRQAIEAYLKINNDYNEKYTNINTNITKIFDKDYCDRMSNVKRISPLEMQIQPNKYAELKDFLYPGVGGRYSSHLPHSSEKDPWLQKIDEFIKKVEPDSEIYRCIEKLRSLVENDKALKDKRENLVKIIEKRYGELEEKIDKLHDSLDKE